MLELWSRVIHFFKPIFLPAGQLQLPSLAGTYEVLSSASVDELWSKVVNLADVSWHPLLAKTNVPYGLIPKPGLIYQAVSRFFPIPIKIFVERVLPREMLTVRVLALPGLEERVTYRIESTVCGTYVSYSVTLRGWLSPLVWSIIRPYAAKVASELAHAAEQAQAQPNQDPTKTRQRSSLDWLGTVLLMVGIEKILSATVLGSGLS
ncbi:SRPBCC family protein [Leptolyngbya sp. NK1-12]|uniref:SRPBCC family protein n=1 Tax=Leptolyngbya sp. NK1-12 TaxID=2547451 RepID=UPI000A851361|nr:SRPBCC family protein [Leptolyngbya sp. NK1-12]